MNRAAIVGAGPSGFYTADQLLKEGFAVDLYDALATPYGLVRAGVAPDHPKIKSVTRVYERTAGHEAFRFFGGVVLGRHLSSDDLLARYDAVVYALGTSADRRLEIPGEDRPGSHSATEFVAWYNGHPDFADQEFDLSGRKAVVIGNGNVAIDVARMLVLDPVELDVTDAADHAISALRDSHISEVVLLGRRGPAEAAFTNPELRELGDLRRADVLVDPSQLSGIDDPADSTRRNNMNLLREYADRPVSGKSHRLELRFLRSPLAILRGDVDDSVAGIRVGINQLVEDADGRVRAVATGDTEVIDCDLVFRSIGYRGTPIDGVPFDHDRGLISNDEGRVIANGEVRRGEYVVGWIKRGPSGVIGTNKKDAAETVSKIVEDAAAGALNRPTQDAAEPAAVAGWVSSISPNVVTWQDWERIDAAEIAQGAPAGRPRQKIVRHERLVATSRRASE